MDMNPEVRFNHCFFHREAIISKTLPSVLKELHNYESHQAAAFTSRIFGVVPGIAA
jgi:hypothetical protein